MCGCFYVNLTPDNCLPKTEGSDTDKLARVHFTGMFNKLVDIAVRVRKTCIKRLADHGLYIIHENVICLHGTAQQ